MLTDTGERTQHASDADASAGPSAQLLFEEARRRRRRIRTAGAFAFVTAVLLAGAVALSLGVAGTGGPRSIHAPTASGTGDAQRRHSIAWIDYAGHLRLGDLSTGAERIVATIDASPLAPVVSTKGSLYVVDTAGTYVRSLGHWSEVVDVVNPLTGAVRYFEPGDGVFRSSDGRFLFIVQMDNRTLLRVGEGDRTKTLVAPHGWYVPAGDGVAVGQYVVVQTNDSQTVTASDSIGLWDLRTGRVAVIAQSATDWTAAAPDAGIIGAYTPPDGRGGLLAWLPPGCGGGSPSPCPIELTNVSTMRTKTVESALTGAGFAPGGAVSPDGRQIAVFELGTASPTSREAVVGLLDASTGRVRLIPGSRLTLGQVATWARWLPDGTSALAGTADDVYQVQSRGGSAGRVYFGTGGPTGTTPDFSTVPLTPTR